MARAGGGGGEPGVPAAEKPTFVSSEIEQDGIELWAAVRVLLSEWRIEMECLFYFVYVEGYFETILIFVTSALNFFLFEKKKWGNNQTILNDCKNLIQV